MSKATIFQFNKLKKYIIIFCMYSFLMATFSIVAVDTTTGEVGSAGGSCIAGSIIISDIHQGVGVIHTQSYYLPANQNYASNLMDAGYSPQEIMELLEENDVQGNPNIRQYGAVDLLIGNNYGLLFEYECNEIEGAVWHGDGGSGQLAECSDPIIPRSASFTGSSCSSWKGHINGINYAIQGNILLNQNILIGMEREFNNTNGSLDQKLMASLQGAKIPGADTRCLDEGISTLSAFIRIAKPNDNDNDYYMDLNVNSVIPYYTSNGIWIDPIDTLQTLYNNWYENTFEYDIGDVNQDFEINILDIVAISTGILNNDLIGMEFYLADVNEDGFVNIQDLVALVNIILLDEV